MKILRETFEQTALQLSSARVGTITASGVGGILGVSKYSTPQDVMRRMVREHYGYPNEFTGNIATQWGHDHEPQALIDASELIGIEIEAAPFIKMTVEINGRKIPLGASPDGRASDGRLVEIKCPFGQRSKKPVARAYLDSSPEYYAQMQWQLECDDKEEVWFVVWTPKGIDAIIVKRDRQWFAEAMKTVQLFWAELQVIFNSPDLAQQFLEDKDQYEIREDELFVSLTDKYLLAVAKFKEAERELEAERQAILDNCNRNTKCKNIMVYKSERKGAVDYKKVPELKGVDLDKYRKASTTWTVKVGGENESE